MVRFSDIRKGDVFSFPGKKKVYVFLGGGPKRGYVYQAYDDIGSCYSTKTNREVEL